MNTIKDKSLIYFNWQIFSNNKFLLVFTQSFNKENIAKFETRILKLNYNGFLILQLLNKGFSSKEVINFLKKKYKLIKKKDEIKIINFINKFNTTGILKLLYNKDLKLHFPSKFLNKIDYSFKSPHIFLDKTFFGLPYEDWTRNVGKYSSKNQFFYPFKVNLEITQNCNLKCKFCYLEHKQYSQVPSQNLSVNKIKQIIDELKKTNVQVVNLFGGEPFLREDIFEIIKYIKEKDMEVNINSNGILLTKEIITKLKALGVYCIHISLDGATPKTYGLMRNENTFNLVLKNIKNARDVGISLGINFTATRLNFMDMLKVYKIVEKIGVTKVTVGCFHKIGEGKNNSKRFDINYVIFFFWAKLFQLILKIPKRKTSFDIRSLCDANIAPFIDNKGNIHFCAQMPRTMPIGNIFEKDFLNIWLSDKYKKLFNINKIKDPCKSCLFRRYCKNIGCRAEIYANTGDFFAGNIFCFRGKISGFFKSLINKNNTTQDAQKIKNLA